MPVERHSNNPPRRRGTSSLFSFGCCRCRRGNSIAIMGGLSSTASPKSSLEAPPATIMVRSRIMYCSMKLPPSKPEALEKRLKVMPIPQVSTFGDEGPGKTPHHFTRQKEHCICTDGGKPWHILLFSGIQSQISPPTRPCTAKGRGQAIQATYQVPNPGDESMSQSPEGITRYP